MYFVSSLVDGDQGQYAYCFFLCLGKPVVETSLQAVQKVRDEANVSIECTYMYILETSLQFSRSVIKYKDLFQYMLWKPPYRQYRSQ